MAQHYRYWSCTKFADVIRGTDKPGACTAEEWDNWHEMAKNNSPVRYWLAETALGKVQDFVTFPARKYRSFSAWFNNRWITKTHSLTAARDDIKPGQWCEFGDRILPCLFNELVEYVEVDLAQSQYFADEEKIKEYKLSSTTTGILWWKTTRCPQAGIDNLRWQSSLCWDQDESEKNSGGVAKPTAQAIEAAEVLELYLWWTKTYRNRPDPYVVSGWNDYCRQLRAMNPESRRLNFPTTPKLKKQGDTAHKKMMAIKKQYEQEDEHMLIRLIKIRKSLWS